MPLIRHVLMATSRLGLIASVAACGAPDAPAPTPPTPSLTSFPLELDPNCRDGRAKIYDECGSQLALLEAAKAQAANEGKTVLVSYGAEWCIWCHVFDQYIQGGSDTFTYTYGEAGEAQKWTDTLYERNPGIAPEQARQLKAFVAERFVLAHINYEFTHDGDAVLDQTGAAEHYPGWIPFIFALDESGRYVGQIAHEDVEVRRDSDDWYRGYDRVKMLAILKDLDEHAQAEP